jgi:PhoPQ-activated pathogenicity-related protein
MSRCSRLLACVLWIPLTSVPVFADDGDEPVPQEMFRFMEQPEPDYGWKSLNRRQSELGTVHSLELVSQKWQGIVWKHALTVYDPPKVEHPGHMLLFITGGRIGRMPGESDHALGLALAHQCRARVATLHQVPNQPLMGDRYEDDLITETWLKYLETGDPTWPLLFPMVKSAVKAMDALEEFARKEWQAEVKHFITTGASKRGWTSWLTPVVDERVVATAPMVIDVLNFPEQMKNQKATWGKYSVQIDDYTSKGLVRPSGEPETPRERRLWRMMDPFNYREKLTLPKLLIVGTNDPYWVVDAMNLYWDDLAGPKYALQVPNAGHGLNGGRDGALRTLAVFVRHAASGQEFPRIDWQVTNSKQQMALTVESDPAPQAVRLWHATAEKRDFRESTWTAQELSGEGSRRSGQIALPEAGHLALFGELRFTAFETPYSLTTLVFVH